MTTWSLAATTKPGASGFREARRQLVSSLRLPWPVVRKRAYHPSRSRGRRLATLAGAAAGGWGAAGAKWNMADDLTEMKMLTNGFRRTIGTAPREPTMRHPTAR